MASVRRTGTGTLNGRPRHKVMELDVQNYIDVVLDLKLTIPARIAQALDYGAETAPGTIIPYNVLLQMVMGFAKLPRLGSEDVDRLRGKMTSAARVLHEKYGRGKHSIPGVGVRATFSDADRLTTEVPRKKKAAGAAMRSLTKSMGAINIKNVPNTPELKEHRDWWLHNSKNVLDTSIDLIRRLLPPAEKK